jgi:hypothetical protein
MPKVPPFLVTANKNNTSNDNDKNLADNDTSWKVVGGRKSETPLRKAKETVHENAETSAKATESGGVSSKVNGGTIEVRFMMDPKQNR